MPKYNLMDNKQPEFFDQYFEQDDKKPEKEESATPKIPDLPDDSQDMTAKLEEDLSELSDEIFDDAAISSLSEEKETTPPAPDFETTDLDEDIPPPPPVPEPQPAREDSKPLIQPFDLESDMDDRQPGMNYKPVVIGIVIIAALAAIFWAGKTYIFGGEEISDPAADTETPQQPAVDPQELQKQNFLATLNHENKNKISHVGSLIDLDRNNIKYASLLLYDNSLNLQIFTPGRDELARFNVGLKNNSRIPEYKIESVEKRPGSNGGLFALYDITIASAGRAAPAATKIDIKAPADWLNSARSRYSLKLSSQRQISSRRENMFSVTRQEFILSGSEQKCHELIRSLGMANSNTKVYKISLLPADQKEMKRSSYQLKLILDFYM